MKIDTKFNIHDDVVALRDNRICSGVITSIVLYPTYKKGYYPPTMESINYKVNFDRNKADDLVTQDDLFYTNEELIANLLEKAKNNE